ncbi:MAG TPA: hypothetical protein VMZ52_16485 [Bryobacteraceae bacterium]|nr:hypothetical protein [Bryobacteraceae bacterium]
MPAIIQQPQNNTKSFDLGLNDPMMQKPIESQIKQSVFASVSLRPGDRVFHEELGFGRVLRIRPTNPG